MEQVAILFSELVDGFADLRGVFMDDDHHHGSFFGDRFFSGAVPLAVGVYHGKAFGESRGDVFVEEMLPLRTGDRSAGPGEAEIEFGL